MDRTWRSIILASTLLIVPALLGEHDCPAADKSDAKFHVYLLLGQSNMAGRQAPEAIDKEPHERVYMLTKDNKWVRATEPVQFDRGVRTGVGPGLSFGKAMAEKMKKVRIGLVPCAQGGSEIARWQKGAGLHSRAIRRAKVAMKDGVLVGIIWHQGENDSLDAEKADQYEKKLHQMIADMRKELGNPKLSFVVATLADFFATRKPEAAKVNAALTSLPKKVKHTACVSSKELAHKGDRLHFSAEGARKLGKRYAEAMVKLLKSGKTKKTKKQ